MYQCLKKEKSKMAKKTINFYLDESIKQFVDDVAEANEGLSRNFVAGKIFELGKKEYLKKLNKSLKLKQVVLWLNVECFQEK